MDYSRFQLYTPLSPSDTHELVCCIQLKEFVIISHAERSCVICILWFIILDKNEVNLPVIFS